MKRPAPRALALGAGLSLWVVALLGTAGAGATRVVAPMVCDRGPSEQKYQAGVWRPDAVAPGATFTVRVDAVPSDEVSGFGLDHIRDMTTDYELPAGAGYVDGSARIVPETGTANVRAGAAVTVEGKRLRLTLPGRVSSGEVYTPPSVELTLRAESAAGTTLALAFSRFCLTVNAVIVGDLQVTCEPRPRPFPLPGTKVVAPP